MASSSVTLIQSLFMVVIFAMTFVSGLVPIFVPWLKKHPILMNLANSFSGGLFLALAITHLLPETNEKYEEWKGEEEEHEEHEEGEEEHGHDHGFNLAFALVLVGYVMILLIDKVLFDTHQLHGHSHGHGADARSKKSTPGNVYDNDPAEVHADEEARSDRNAAFVAQMSGVLQEDSKAPEHNESKANKKELEDIENTDEKAVSQEEDTEVKYDKTKLFSLAAITFMLGLSAHSLFEGIVVGLEEERREVWSLILAIASHKWAASISLGISLHKSFDKNYLLIVILLIVFSLSTPIGVGIGMIISKESDLTNVIFNALAAGTFIYVAASEIISEEFSSLKYRWYKMAALVVGAGFIVGVNEIDW